MNENWIDVLAAIKSSVALSDAPDRWTTLREMYSPFVAAVADAIHNDQGLEKFIASSEWQVTL